MQTASKTRAKSASRTAKSGAHGGQPGKTFIEPAHVVADPDLSTREKIRVLNSLEQDARQMAVAAAEGMSGGEQTRLRDILQAKRMLESPPFEAAFTVVRQTFEARLQTAPGTETHTLITRALDALKAARKAISEPTKTPSSELDEELAKEKLDP